MLFIAILRSSAALSISTSPMPINRSFSVSLTVTS